MHRNITRASSLSLVVLLGLAACSDDSESTDTVSTATPTTEATTASPTTAPAAEAAVVIADFSFQTGDGVTAGEEFTVANNDRTAHTLTDVAGAFSLRVDGDNSDTLVIAEPGTYQVVCEIHSSMTGTLTVK